MFYPLNKDQLFVSRKSLNFLFYYHNPSEDFRGLKIEFLYLQTFLTDKYLYPYPIIYLYPWPKYEYL